MVTQLLVVNGAVRKIDLSKPVRPLDGSSIWTPLGMRWVVLKKWISLERMQVMQAAGFGLGCEFLIWDIRSQSS